MSLDYFVGKICTVFTVPLNRDFKSENPAHYPQQVYDYFMGLVESVDENTLVLNRLKTGHRTLFFISKIVSIAEEEVIIEGTKEHEELQGQLQAIPQVLNNEESEFIDPAEMAKLSQELMKTMSN